jgi:hypothetical protein
VRRRRWILRSHPYIHLPTPVSRIKPASAQFDGCGGGRSAHTSHNLIHRTWANKKQLSDNYHPLRRGHISLNDKCTLARSVFAESTRSDRYAGVASSGHRELEGYSIGRRLRERALFAQRSARNMSSRTLGHPRSRPAPALLRPNFAHSAVKLMCAPSTPVTAPSQKC